MDSKTTTANIDKLSQEDIKRLADFFSLLIDIDQQQKMKEVNTNEA